MTTSSDQIVKPPRLTDDECTCPSCFDETDLENAESYGAGLGYAEAMKELQSAIREVEADKAKLQADVSALEAERDEALDRVEELEAYGESVSEEFEKDCWVALRTLLNNCHFDWHYGDEGVSANDAYEHISSVLDESEKYGLRHRERAEKAESAFRALHRMLKEVELAATVGTLSATGYKNALAQVLSITRAAREQE